MNRGTKTLDVIGLKAGPDDGLEEGVVSAMISVYGVKDGDGDIIDEGEFDAFVESFTKGDAGVLPHVNHHDHSNPYAYTGEVIRLDPKGEATMPSGEKVKGLVADVKFDLDQPEMPEAAAYARKVYENIKSGRVKQWSHAWRAESAKRGKDGRHLKGLSLDEVASVLRGANRLTSTLAVKAAGDDPDAGTPLEQVFDWVAGELDADTVETLGALADAAADTGEARAALVLMIGRFADCLENDYPLPMQGMWGGEAQVKSGVSADPVEARLQIERSLPPLAAAG